MVKYQSLHQSYTTAFFDTVILVCQFVQTLFQIGSHLSHMFYYMVLFE